MIIKSFQFKFKELSDKKFFLFYGGNQGLIEQTIKENFNSVFKDQIFKYDENEIIKNSENFNNEILSKSFFESKKLIIIQRITDKIFNIIEDIINKDIEDITILLISETLEKKSKLRKLFEKQNSIICVPFYEDNVQSLNLMASSFLKEKKISLSQQNINLIVNRSRGDRINLLNELQKIENFSKNKKQINIDEIYKLTNLSENFNITELVDNTLAKNKNQTIYILNENNFSTEDAILILRIFINKLKRLLSLQSQMKIKNNVEQVITNFRPPIFWKEKELVKKQIKISNFDKILKLLKTVNNLELLIKKNPTISMNVVTDFILQHAGETNN
jgi:DNA polymerase-3 subunit delta